MGAAIYLTLLARMLPNASFVLTENDARADKYIVVVADKLNLTTGV